MLDEWITINLTLHCIHHKVVTGDFSLQKLEETGKYSELGSLERVFTQAKF